MALITTHVELKWNKRNKEHYTSKGYVFTKTSDCFMVSVTDLTIGSHVRIDVSCDYCHEVITLEYRTYKKQQDKSPIKKDACKTCSGKKTKESNLLVYGVENVMHVNIHKKAQENAMLEIYGVLNPSLSKVVQEKRRRTNLERFGVGSYFSTKEFQIKKTRTIQERYGEDHYTQTSEYLEKLRKTCLEKYGFNHHLSSPDVIQKRIKTVKEKYGVKNVFQSERVKLKSMATMTERYGEKHFSLTEAFSEKLKEYWREAKKSGDIKRVSLKRRNTCLKRYGKKHPMQVPEFKKRAMKTMMKNGTAPASSQQVWIHKVIGGKLNYVKGFYFLDIALPDKKIYLEYDGGGHDLSVKLGSVLPEEFKLKENKRFFSLRDKGWKAIRVISPHDKLPTKDELKMFFEDSLKEFKKDEGLYSIRWHIEENRISYSRDVHTEEAI